jgi:hypothetical protein
MWADGGEELDRREGSVRDHDDVSTRLLIRTRTSEGRERAKARGQYMGAPQRSRPINWRKSAPLSATA